jgi:ClpP class serine protease
MKKIDAHVDTLLDALVWMRRKAKRREPVDKLVDALLKMRRKAKTKVAKRKKSTKTRAKSKA